MMHTRRRHHIADAARKAQENGQGADVLGFLATRLARHTYTACTGWEYEGLLFLNDSTSEDAAQEYAVVDKATSTQIESLTCSWMKPEELARVITALVARKVEGMTRTPVTVREADYATCQVCA